MLVYINDSSERIVIASYALFDLCAVYKASGMVAYLLDLRVKIDENDYRRLIGEANLRGMEEVACS
jgi:hypothetical protein